MTDRPVSLLRSVLFVPGNRPDRIGKAARSGADAVVLDLEDAVPAREKARARAVVADALAEVRGPLTCVRIQALETGLWKDDLNAIVGPGLDAVMLPKASPQSVVELAGRLSELEGERDLAGPVSILPLVETPGGIVDGAEIAAASPRVRTLVLGSGDLTRELDLLTIRWSRSGEELAYARAKLIVDARAAGCERPIDGPYLEVRDAEGFLADCERARVLGFQGKLCLHPDQVPVANQRFGPDPAEVEFCRRVIAAAEAAEAEGSAALTVDGVFVDIALARKARRIVAIAEALESASPRNSKGASMLTIVVKLRINEGMEEEYAKLAERITRTTHAEDKGCIAYAYLRDVDNPRDFVVYEQWTDEAALDAHVAQLQRNHGPPKPGERLPASIGRYFESNDTHFYEVVADR